MKKFFIAAGTLALLLTISSCLTPSYNKSAPLNNEGASTAFAGVSFKATPLSIADLEQRYGTMAPCFIRYPGMIPPKNIYILQVEVTSSQHKLSIQPDSARLLGSKSGIHALSNREISERIGNYLSDSELQQFNRLIELDYEDEKIFINPQMTERYMLLFISTQMRDEEAYLEIPAQSGGDTGIIRLPIEWPESSESDLNNTGDRNSGIFLEQEKGE